MRAHRWPAPSSLPRLLFLILTLLPATAALAAGWSGYIAGEFRFFNQQPAYPRQHGGNLSLSAEPEFYHQWDDGRQSFTFTPYVRLDDDDPRRSHFDIRELTWSKAADTWELCLGISKVFWGVTESVHLVDIINQTDLVENLDAEDKLGQPMVNLALIRDWGTVDLFLLPGFRERTFPGPEGRLRPQPAMDTNHARYESGAGRRHVDWALRWSHSIGDWDLGVSHFYGTSREPTPRAVFDRAGRLSLAPFYPLIHQTGLDLQMTGEDWLWKFEFISRHSRGERYTAAAAGFEYTLYAIRDSAADLGLLAEYLFDDRGNHATTPFQDDLFLGLRLTLNDAQSSELLAGVIADRKTDSRFFNLEASRRLGDAWKLTLEMRLLSSPAPGDALHPIRQDDYLQGELAWYF